MPKKPKNTPLMKLPSGRAAVSRAFSCLSNGQKRAAYDRDGEERAPGAPRQWPPGGGGGSGFDDFDPEEIFNMFFNGGIPTRCCPTLFMA